MSRILPPEAFQIFPISKLTQLEEHFDLIIFSACALHLVFVIGGLISSRISSHYRNLSPGKQASWRIHIVSMVFSLLVIPLSIPVYSIKIVQDDKLFGSSPYSAKLFSFAIGYFFWDLIVSIIYFAETGWPFVFHATACMSVFMFALYPYAQGYGPVFLLFEVSTVFLNVHWFCDKTGRAGSTLQWINGIFLLSSFFTVRLVYGIYSKFEFVTESFRQRDRVPTFFLVFYTVAAIGLGLLNIYWFSVMIRSVASRFKEDKVSNKKKQ